MHKTSSSRPSKTKKYNKNPHKYVHKYRNKNEHNILTMKNNMKKSSSLSNDIKLYNKSTKSTNIQSGGNNEAFELQSTNDLDYRSFTLSKYIQANTNWGKLPRPPPTPDCTIL